MAKLVKEGLLALALVVKQGERKHVGGLVQISKLFIELTDALVINECYADLGIVLHSLVVESFENGMANEHFELVVNGVLLLIVFKINL